MKLVYDVNDKPSWGKTVVFALQQLLAIMAATIAVPMIVGNGMSTSAALFGAGVGTLVYLLFTKFKSPVFLGSSFAFLGSMFAAFGGAVSMSVGFLGLIIGAALAGLVYVVIAIVVKFCGSAWVNKIMPAVVIGPTVAIIGLSLAGNAIGDLFKGSYYIAQETTGIFDASGIAGLGTSLISSEALLDGNFYAHYWTSVPSANIFLALACGLVTLFVTIACSVYGKKMMKMIPFIIGIAAGYAVAAIFTGIGYAANNDALKVINFELFANAGWDKFVGGWCPDFTFITAFSGNYDWGNFGNFGAYLGTIAVAYVPVAFVVFAEHIADHKNLSSIIEHDLLEDPGLHRTLLGDGVGSMAGAFFGGAANTTYGESVGCVAISGNASIRTIFVTALLCLVLSFLLPFATFLATIPSCVMGGVCIALYGFIAVSGLKMIQPVDLGDNRNLFVVSVILIAGVGGMTLVFGKVTITEIAAALILGILVNLLVHIRREKKQAQEVKE